jgi:hypothetical protein
MRRWLLALLLLLLPAVASAQTTFTLSVASTNCEFALSCAGISTTNAPNGTIQISANASGNTISFETSTNGSTWVAISVTPVASTTTVTSTTGTGVWTFQAQPLFRARLSTLAGGTTTVTLISTSARMGGSGSGAGLSPPLTTDGTNLTNTGQYLGPAGAVGTPTFADVNEPTKKGWWFSGTGTSGRIRSAINGVSYVDITQNGIEMAASNLGVLWSGTASDPTAAKVLRAYMASNGVLTLDNAAGGAGTLKVVGMAQVGGTTALTLTQGAFGFTAITASASAPGASGGKLELVCGTNPGTAKLIIYAGTSGTAVPVTDNIGAGVTGC